MGKKGKVQKNDKIVTKRRKMDEDFDDMDDDIDAFHKQRDMVPLDVNDDVEESDEDDEDPVFDLEEYSSDDANDDENDVLDTGLAAKIARQQHFLLEKSRGVDDEMHENGEDEEEKKVIWGKKLQYYGGDNHDFELQSSGNESAPDEELEVQRLLKKKTESLSKEDFGLEDISEEESDRELTLEEHSGKVQSSSSKETMDMTDVIFKKVKKDLNSLSKEEQMDVVYSSAPELVGLLSELNDATEQLESKVNPLLKKVKERGSKLEGGMRYLETKQILLLAYCQAITFYLLLKSEGQPVRDHPVIARLVEIKGLLEKIKQLDGNPFGFEEALKNYGAEVLKEVPKEVSSATTDFFANGCGSPHVVTNTQQREKSNNVTELATVDLSKDRENREGKRKHQDDQVGLESTEMLKVRAALEEKLKQKGVFGTLALKPDKARKNIKLRNGHLETYNDFDDETIDAERKSKISQPLTAKAKKLKVVSGDDDLPKRDEIGERRRKHELKVLAGAGVNSEDDAGNDLKADGDSDIEEGGTGSSEGDTGGSEDEFYKQVKQERAAKMSAKAEKYSRTPAAAPAWDETVDGKRHISYQMEKNRGLTRSRNKKAKNPRTNYKRKHDKALKDRKGQVRDIKKPCGAYGGEASGINTKISRSTRLKN